MGHSDSNRLLDTNETNNRLSRIIVKRKNSELIRHVLCVHIYHKEAENVTCSSCIVKSATKNGYSNQTIASENFTGMLNKKCLIQHELIRHDRFVAFLFSVKRG